MGMVKPSSWRCIALEQALCVCLNICKGTKKTKKLHDAWGQMNYQVVT